LENLGGVNAVVNNQSLFKKLGGVDQKLFIFLNEIILRIGITPLPLNIIGFNNIIKYVFKLDNMLLFRLLDAIGISLPYKPYNSHRISASSRIRKSPNNFTD
jgi:hypothetical protein